MKQEGVKFTNTWDGKIPTSAAACFLFDALREIDPDRQELASELRDLMQNTVKDLPGKRQGRKLG